AWPTCTRTPLRDSRHAKRKPPRSRTSQTRGGPRAGGFTILVGRAPRRLYRRGRLWGSRRACRASQNRRRLRYNPGMGLKDIDMEAVLRRLADRKTEEAIREGKFDK